MTEPEIIDTAALHRHASQWPTLREALGCVDCLKLFRASAECPFCGSAALLNVADILAGGTQWEPRP